ncbi:methyltransferase, FkbM family [Ekhidna lutea]|uniref:Methyltransferase, FkbM family n=1 Tax=Ekhidna lutea TaxID=447679 RepID=A0A239L382_EKHLU|nr:FkbM family methyltransferase [Ekhidna lutea]SNT24273.1 methyltransferase, FkbM family [Ekhidna lutea]
MNENILTRSLNKIEGILRFPNLKSGEIGIQVGFDLSQKNLTSDLFRMSSRVSPTGMVIAIDPDPANHERLKEVMERKKLNFTLIQKATYSKKTSNKLILGTRSSYNKLDIVQSDSSPSYTNDSIEVEMDTLDNMVEALNIDYSLIKHICITNNGAEYETLLGMETIFEKCENLNLTIASGRTSKMGEINGRRDHIVISEFLANKGFTSKLIRLNKSFWSGFVIHLIAKRKWVFNKKRFGFIIAARGDRKLKFYQSLY